MRDVSKNSVTNNVKHTTFHMHTHRNATLPVSVGVFVHIILSLTGSSTGPWLLVQRQEAHIRPAEFDGRWQNCVLSQRGGSQLASPCLCE